MNTGIITPSRVFETMPYFQIEDYLVGLVRETIKKDTSLHSKYLQYKERMTRISPEVAFAIVEMGYMIADPFAKGENTVLFSNGRSIFIASRNYIMSRYFDRESLTDKGGMPLLTDEVLKYDKLLANPDKMEEGIIDSKGYVDSSCMSTVTEDTKTQTELLASMLLLNDMLQSERIYKDALTNRKNQTDLEYITSKPNCIGIKRDGKKFQLSYVSENNGIVENFIEKLESNNQVTKYGLQEVPSGDLMVKNEDDDLVVYEAPVTGLRVK